MASITNTTMTFANRQLANKIISEANIIKNDPELLKKHMWKTKPCVFGIDCKRDPDQCAGSHFIEEYRPPVCLYLEICKNQNCDKFHPNRCSLESYIVLKKIDSILVKRSYLERRLDIEKKARETMSNPELLRQHLHRTRKCFNGVSCSNKEKCNGAHFLNEYRLPICLKMEFCSDEKCQHFHENRQTKENYMYSQGISFEYNTLEELEELEKSNLYTQLCSFVKEDSPCSRNKCSFAHSLEELVLPECICPNKEICDKYHSSLDILDPMNKLEAAKRILKIDIPSYFLRQSYENSSYNMMLLDDILITEQMIDGLEFLTEEETYLDQLYFYLDFNKLTFNPSREIYEDFDVRIDYPSISHIIKSEK